MSLTFMFLKFIQVGLYIWRGGGIFAGGGSYIRVTYFGAYICGGGLIYGGHIN